MNCRHCGRPVRPRNTPPEQHPGTTRVESRGLCHACHRDPDVRIDYASHWHDREELLEDVRMALAAGRRPADVAAAVGLSRGAIAKAAQRAKDFDVARRFWRVPTSKLDELESVRG